MNTSLHRRLNRRKRRILRRLENQPGIERPEPMLTASNIHYELTDRTRAIAPGGIGAIHLLARRVGLIQDIDEGLHLLKRHLPYHESDHVLNIAYNLLAGGSRLEHIEVRRTDEVHLDALGARRIPDPTTAGDFRRRFAEAEQEFREILEREPVDHYAHFALGRCLEKQGRPKEAVGHYKMATFFRPQSREYRKALDSVEAA